MSRLRQLFLFPSAAVMSVLFALPLAIVAVYSLLSRGPYGGVFAPFTIENYSRVFDGLYLAIFWRSVWVAFVATIICALLAFPMALYIARSPRKTLLLNLVVLPFWTSFLIRTYAWMFLLRDTGLINTALVELHIFREPLPLLFNTAAVILGLVYGYLPFMVLPLYATLEKLDPALLDAASDLGAGPIASVLKVVVPQSRPGLVAGFVLVFIPCLGAYLTPDFLGGGKSVMIGTVIDNQFTAARDWPFGSALSLMLLAVVFAVTMLIRKQSEELL